jgi:uncharacterized membrane protein YeaQ/YmgE (transglycosylase-associated protein family)
MNFIAWLIVGGLAGWIGGKVMNTGGQGLISNIITGIIGAMIGGFVMNFFGARGVTGLNIPSILVAVIGSVILIWLLKALRSNK